MPIESFNGGTVVTGSAIPLVRLMALKGRLKLEAMGMKSRGGSTFTAVKREFGFKGNKAKVLATFEAYLEAEKLKYANDPANGVSLEK